MRNLEGKCGKRDDFQILSLKFFVGERYTNSLSCQDEYSSLWEGLKTDSGTMEEQPAQVSCLGDKLPLFFIIIFIIIYQFGKYWKIKLCTANMKALGQSCVNNLTKT